MRTAAITLSLVLAAPAAFADEPAPQPAPAPQPPVVRSDGALPYQAPAASPYVTPRSVAYEGGRIPEGATMESKPNGVLVGTGVGLFGASYLGALLYALGTCSAQEDCRKGSQFLYIPVVGPWLTAATAPTSGGAALAAFDGGVQTIGAALFAAGFIWKKQFVVWQDPTGAASLEVTPVAAGTGAGVGLTLTHL